MLWVIFIQAALILPLLSPGVLSIGTAYAIGSVFYVGLAIFAENKDMICNAARLNTGVAIGNILLQFLVWSSCQSLSCHVSAAYRAAWFTVAGIVMIILSEYLLRKPPTPKDTDDSSARKITAQQSIASAPPSPADQLTVLNSPPNPPLSELRLRKSRKRDGQLYVSVPNEA